MLGIYLGAGPTRSSLASITTTESHIHNASVTPAVCGGEDIGSSSTAPEYLCIDRFITVAWTVDQMYTSTVLLDTIAFDYEAIDIHLEEIAFRTQVINTTGTCWFVHNVVSICSAQDLTKVCRDKIAHYYMWIAGLGITIGVLWVCYLPLVISECLGCTSRLMTCLTAGSTWRHTVRHIEMQQPVPNPLYLFV